jgi:hypothetical protein
VKIEHEYNGGDLFYYLPWQVGRLAVEVKVYHNQNADLPHSASEEPCMACQSAFDDDGGHDEERLEEARHVRELLASADVDVTLYATPAEMRVAVRSANEYAEMEAHAAECFVCGSKAHSLRCAEGNRLWRAFDAARDAALSEGD